MIPTPEIPDRLYYLSQALHILTDIGLSLLVMFLMAYGAVHLVIDVFKYFY